MEDLLLIGIPCLDTIKTETVASLFSATSAINVPARLHLHKSSYVHDSRNKIVEYALQTGASHVMFIDSDMQFPREGIQQLLDHKKDIVGGLYYRRQPPHLPTINEVEGEKLVVPTKFPTDKLFTPFSVATGFLLIKTDVFRKIKGPWFGFGNFHGKQMGEDVFFCWKARQHKYEVFCDPTIKLGHVGEYVYGKQDFDVYQEEIAEMRKLKEAPSGEFDGQL